MPDRANLSKKLYDVLEHVGASEKMRKLYQHTAVIQEVISTFKLKYIQNRSFTVFYCGSTYEGSVTPDLASDIDLIQCRSYFPVYIDDASFPTGMSFLVVKDSYTPPGYVKMQIVYAKEPQFYPSHEVPVGCADLDSNDRICFNHFKIDDMKGPAIPFIDENGVHQTDMVPALHCNDVLPADLEWWMARPRPYDWPSQEQLRAMGGMGCMFVSVGHVYSTESNIEWRVSYTLQERFLMSNLNPVQHKVYILLKMIKISILHKEVEGESLTSYHLKTCLLYAVRMTSSHIWTQDNLIQCLVTCLKLMIKWLEVNNCPSFLVKDQNLFLKESIAIKRVRVLAVLRNIVNSDYAFLYKLRCDHVGMLLRDGNNKLYHALAADNTKKHTVKLIHRCLDISNCKAMQLVRYMCDGCYDPVTILFCLEWLEKSKMNSHTLVETQSVLSNIYPLFHLHIAMSLASKAQTETDKSNTDRWKKITDNIAIHFKLAKFYDLVNARLAMASIHYTNGEYEVCINVLDQIELVFDHRVRRVCPCTNRFHFTCFGYKNRYKKYTEVAKMSIPENRAILTASCVCFLPSESYIVPHPLRLEMKRSAGTKPDSRHKLKDFWFDWAVVDAKVYLHFLQYLASAKIANEERRCVARAKLRYEIARSKVRGQRSCLHHKDTAYNLLGWIYMQERRYAEANACFKESWTIRPHHNAAKYHMISLADKLDGRSRMDAICKSGL